MNKEQNLIVVSGPSGSGKDTVVKALMEKYPTVEISVSATTREKRPGEKEGVNYYYMSVSDFEKKLADGEILEHTCYCGNYYGTPKAEVDYRIEHNIPVVLVIEVEGAKNIKKQYPHSTTVFVRPPSYEELSNRLRGRGTENEEVIQVRLARAVEEMEYAVDYDYVIVNDAVEDCVEELYAIIEQSRK
ncbi:MAG: guanylate kinase [Oscillospiraceae bacterium]|nr:guanylate kinase [Oscillospiraceae bacterium]